MAAGEPSKEKATDEATSLRESQGLWRPCRAASWARDTCQAGWLDKHGSLTTTVASACGTPCERRQLPTGQAGQTPYLSSMHGIPGPAMASRQALRVTLGMVQRYGARPASQNCSAHVVSRQPPVTDSL